MQFECVFYTVALDFCLMGLCVYWFKGRPIQQENMIVTTKWGLERANILSFIFHIIEIEPHLHFLFRPWIKCRGKAYYYFRPPFQHQYFPSKNKDSKCLLLEKENLFQLIRIHEDCVILALNQAALIFIMKFVI